MMNIALTYETRFCLSAGKTHLFRWLGARNTDGYPAFAIRQMQTLTMQPAARRLEQPKQGKSDL